MSERAAGLELDVEVHEVVFGVRVDPEDCGCTDCITGMSVSALMVPPYSTSIIDAWEVVENVRAMGGEWEIACPSAQWVVQVWGWPGPDIEMLAEVAAPTAPHAICLAALAALQADRGAE